MNLSRREKVLIGILALTAFVYLFHNFYYTPLNKERERLIDESTAMKILIERGKAANQEKLVLERQTNKIENEYAGLLTAIPSSAHTPETIAFMEAKCQEAGVTLLSIKYTPVDRTKDETGARNNQSVTIPNNVHETKYSMEVRGNYNNLTDFMARVENAPALFIVRSYKIMANTDTLPIEPAKSSNTKTADDNALNKGADSVLSLELSSFYYADQLKMPTGMESDKVLPGEGRSNPYTPASPQ